MGEPGRDRLDPGGGEPLDHLSGHEAGRQVEVGNVRAQREVADRAADEAAAPVGRVERVEQMADARPIEPGRRIKLHEAAVTG